MAFNPRNAWGTDQEKENDGVVIDLGDGASITIGRYLSDRHRKVYDRLARPYRTQTLAGRPIPDDVAIRIEIESLAEAVLLDWSGFTGDDGAALPYSKDAAIKLLTDLRDFRAQVTQIAQDAANFRREAIEVAEKN
jgi:hypothetical protein